MNNPFARSLSLRLLGIFAITALLSVAVLATLFTQGLGSQWRRSIRPHLVQYVRYVQEDLGQPPDPERARLLAERLPVSIAIYRGGAFVSSTSDWRPDLDALRFRQPPSPVRRDLADDGGMRSAIARERDREGTVLRIERGPDTVYYRLGSPPGRRGQPGDGLYLGLFAVLLVLLGSYLAIRRQLAPIRRIQTSVRRISGGELEHRVALGGRDDLAELGRAIDDMAHRLGGMLDAKRQLLLALSHELRSPLARARVALELMPDSRQRERLGEDLAEMARLIEDLTESERLRTPHAALSRERIDLVALVAEEIAPRGLTPRVSIADHASGDGDGSDGGEKDRTGNVDTDGTSPPLFVEADAPRLRVLVRNLVGNAFCHGRSAEGEAEVRVAIAARPDTLRLEVADRGPGIAAEHLEAVTEPFHRLDPSRTRTSGGVGLGLSLARLVAEAHGGTLTVESDPAREPGTRVVVSLPRDATPENRRRAAT